MERSDLEKFDDDVDRYFKGQMSESEEASFMERVDADPELRERLTTIALMKKAMHDIRIDETHHVAAEIGDMHEDEYRQRAGCKQRHRPRILRMQFIRYAAAACLIGIIVATAWYMMRPNPYAALGNSFDYYAYDTDITGYGLRGDDELASLDNYALARLFANVADGSELDTTIDALEPALAEATDNDSELADPIAWNLAIAYLKDGNGERARAILDAMLERNRCLYPESEAVIQSLIDQIDEIAR